MARDWGAGRSPERVAAHLGWWRFNLVVFAAAQVLDVATTASALRRGLVEGSPLSRALMPGGQLWPWVLVKLLSIILVGSLAGFVLARRFSPSIRVAVGLIIAALSALTLVTAFQNVVLAAGL